MGGRVFDLYPHKCTICGKAFEAGLMYAYKRETRSHGKIYWFCSYHCMREFDKRKEKAG